MQCRQCAAHIQDDANYCVGCGAQITTETVRYEMNFVTSLMTCFKKYFIVVGRAPLSEFWWFVTFYMTMHFTVYHLDKYINKELSGLSGLVLLVLSVPFFTVTIRRLHDINRSGKWCFIAFTGIGLIVLFLWLIKQGDAGKNNYVNEKYLMSFSESVATCFRKYFNFYGRASRSEYWWFILFQSILLPIGSVFDYFIDKELMIITAIINIITFFPNFSVYVRRLHDTNHSGWWGFLGFTIIGIIPLFIWTITKGSAIENKYGEPSQTQ